MKKSMILAIMSMILLVGILPVTVRAEEPSTSGTCGRNVEWSFDTETGTLTISGEGAMENFAYDVVWDANQAFRYYKDQIRAVVLEEGVTAIGEFAFNNCTNLDSVTFPDSLKRIGIGAFAFCVNLTDISIPESVTSIESEVFYGCSSLTEVTLPEKLVAINESLFADCSSLERVSIPAEVKSIGARAFKNCGSLQEIMIPDRVKRISEEAFYNCTSLTKAVIGGGVQEIDPYAFYICESLTELFISDGVSVIGEAAFAGCGGLTSVTIPASVTEICEHAFSWCSNLTVIGFEGNAPQFFSEYGSGCFVYVEADCYYPADNLTWTDEVLKKDVGGGLDWIPYEQEAIVTSGMCNERIAWILTGNGTLYVAGKGEMPDYDTQVPPWQDYAHLISSAVIAKSVSSIGNSAFSGHTNLKTVSMGDAVKYIGSNAFYGCTDLTDIDFPRFPRGWQSIGSYAFGGCTSLTSLKIPSGVKIIDTGVFYGCVALRDVTLPSSVTCIEKAAFQNCFALKYLEIPGSVTSIGADAFRDSGLRNITVPDAVESVGSHVFAGCEGLNSVVLGKGITEITTSMFAKCTNLTNITIPESISAIGTAAFSGCSKLTKVVIPASVGSVGALAFSGCSGVARVYFEGDAPVLGTDVFAGDTADCYYPKGNPTWTETITQDYGGSITWTAYGILDSGSCGKNVEWKVMADYTLIISGEGPMTNYDYECFEPAPWLRNRWDIRYVEIGDGVTHIGSYAFYQFKSLVDVTIADSVKTIGHHAFYECEKLTHITIPPKVTKLELDTFAYCGSLNDILLPEGLVSIGEYAFRHCTSLSRLILPADLKTIETVAFLNCGVQEIYFQGDAPEIDQYAFERVTTSAYYPANNASWSEDYMKDYGGNITWETYDCIHDFKAVITRPTCTKRGFTMYTCVNCGDQYMEDLTEAIGHTEQVDAAVAATCTEDGLTGGEHCSVCCMVLIAQEIIPATGHSFENGKCEACGISDSGAILWGDANGDGNVDNVDAMMILQYVVGLDNGIGLNLTAADVDGSGTVDNVDAMMILQYAVGLIKIFPVNQ